MAQTRTITRKKLAALAVLDFGTRALHAIYRPPRPRSTPPRSFLVVEAWGIGDVVLSTVALKGIRSAFPDSRITLLAKEHARDLLRGTDLADEIVAFDFPWTSFSRKFAPSRYEADSFRELMRTLRRADFDVSLDARRDVRSNVITYLAGARRRIGYDFGGGAHLLTDIVPSGSQDEHKVADWLALLRPLGINARALEPSLALSSAERQEARTRLTQLGFDLTKPVIGVHPGASNSVRRWKGDRFAHAIDDIARAGSPQILLFEHQRGDSADIRPSAPVTRFQASLREFMGLVAECSLLLCSDSGPMHIAGALGVPVTALFGPQRREWYGPRGELDRVVHIEEMPCRPCFDRCIFTEPRCMDGIAVDTVVMTVADQLQRVARKQQPTQI